MGRGVHKMMLQGLRGSPECLKWNQKEIPVLKEVIEIVPQHRVVVQAGGNLGVFPKVLSGRFKTVYTFEPDPELFEIMCTNAPERNIVKFQAALGYERKMVGMSRQRDDGGIPHEGVSHVSGSGNIPTLQIDDLGLPVCDLIYLDIEGYELHALRGATTTIVRCKPVVACEINKSLEHMDGITREDVHTWFRIRDYEFLKKIRSDEIFIPRAKIHSFAA